MKMFDILREGNNQAMYKLPFNPHVHISFKKDEMFGEWEHSTFLDQNLHGNYGTLSLVANGNKQLEGEIVQWCAQIGERGFVFPRMGKTCKTKEGERRWGFLYGSASDGHVHMYMIEDKSKQQSLADLGLRIMDQKKADKDLRRIFAYHKEHFMANTLARTEMTFEQFADQYMQLTDPMQLARFEKRFPGQGLKEYKRLVRIARKRYAGAKIEIAIAQARDGKVFAIINHDISKYPAKLKALVDGHFFVDPAALQQAGMRDRHVSDFFKGTVATPLGLLKGFGRPKKLMALNFDGQHVPVWFIGYGAKKRVTYDNVFFGNLGYNTVQDSNLDVQSFVNFFDTENPWLEERTWDVVNEFIDDIHQENRFQAQVLKNLQGNAKEAGHDNWFMLQLAEVGWSYFKLAPAFKTACRMQMDEVLNAEKASIDIGDRSARVQLASDPYMFDGPDGIGLCFPELTVIPKNTVCSMDTPVGESMAHRQPNAMSKEASLVHNVHLDEFKAYKGAYIMFLGPDGHNVLIVMNGADLDDYAVVYFKPEIVAAMKKLTYPVTAKLEDLSHLQVKAIRSIKAMMYDKMFGGYSWMTFIEAVKDSFAFGSKIGQIVNLIILDSLLSGKHKKHMLIKLKARIEMAQAIVAANQELPADQHQAHESIELLTKAYKWLKQRKDYQARHAATNLEALIDYTQQGKDLGQKDVLDQMIQELTSMVWEHLYDENGRMLFGDDKKPLIRVNTLVFPEMYAMEHKNRISARLVKDVDYVLAPSLCCEELRKVVAIRQDLEHEVEMFTWALPTGLPDELEQLYPLSKDLWDEAKKLRSWYNEQMHEIAGMTNPEEARAARKKMLYGEFNNVTRELVAPGWLQMLEAYDETTQESLVIHMYRISHRRFDDEPQWGVPASCIGNNVSIAIFLRAAGNVEGLLGKYVAVDFCSHARRSQKMYGKGCDVVVQDNAVLRKHDGYWIGTAVKDVANGEYRLTPYGWLEIAAASPAIATPDTMPRFGGMDIQLSDEARMERIRAAREEQVARQTEQSAYDAQAIAGALTEASGKEVWSDDFSSIF